MIRAPRCSRGIGVDENVDIFYQKLLAYDHGKVSNRV